MALDKIYDFAWIVVIIGLVFVTFGLGIQSILDDGADGDATLFTNISNSATTNIKNAGDAQEAILSGDEDSGEETTADNYLLSGLSSLFSLGETWIGVRDTIDDGTSTLGIDPAFITLLGSALLITFAALLYSWFRGN